MMTKSIKTIQIPQDGVGMSRVDEMKIITDFIYALPVGSYLKNILHGVDKYCKNQIENDFSINLMDTIQENMKNESDNLKCVNESKGAVAILERQLEKQNLEYETKIKKLEDTKSFMQLHIDNLNKTISECNTRIMELGNEKVMQSSHCIAMENQLIKLKARMFDLMEKNELGGHEGGKNNNQ